MQTIIDFFKNFIDIVISIVDFVVGLFQDLIYMIKLLGEFIVKIPQYIGWLPTSSIALIVAIFAIVIIYKILGREG